MSTNRWVNPVQNSLLYDLQGNLLASGSIAIYEAGTSTPLEVYANPDQTGSLGSTLNCDAYGLIPDFHLPENTQFKVVAYDAQDGASGTGAVKWTRDYLYTSDKSVETRLASLETTVNGLNTGVLNGIINGGMRVATKDILTLTSSFLEGKVYRLFGRVTNVTAGTLTQGASIDYASGNYALFSGVSTSATAVVEAQIRVAAGEAARFADKAVVFSCLVRHDTGSATDYTITVKTPTSTADDFSSLTTIGTSSATSVVSGTDTRLEFSVSDMGDCSKGIAIEIGAAVGTITTKNFRISEAQLEVGATRTSFVMTHAEVEASVFRSQESAYSYGHIYGLTISNGTDATNDINIGVGAARSSDDTVNMTVSTAIGKQIDAAWAAGGTTASPAGGFPTGISIANDTWYRVFLISTPGGTVDAGFDTSATAVNLLANATGYTKYRQIGWIRRDTAANKAFTHRNGAFYYTSQIADVNSNNPGTSLVTSSLTVPPDEKCDAMVNVKLRRDGAASGYSLIVAPTFVTIPTPTTANSDLTVEGGSEIASTRVRVPVNSSGQITYQLSASDASTDIYINTLGFFFNA